MTIAQRLAQVRERIEKAAVATGRSSSDLTLVAVSKTFDAAAVIEAAAAGATDFGENKAQELKRKASMVEVDVRWHFVGRLQTNKVKDVIGCELIHSVDSARLAEAIARRAAGGRQRVLVEVNVAGDESKAGIDAEQALDLARRVAELEGLVLAGLMTMPPYPQDPEESRPPYKKLAALGKQLVREFPQATELSMGMTRDLEVAVEEGATLVRVGEAIFGPRPRSA
ncbi:MAG: YggS family pyridoxal phosphate-dependent enzyme [Actinomycetota bacterium]|nr:YggS family pyridoxal phosphate-dependent enzyme [Actinomycetota bacterium]